MLNKTLFRRPRFDVLEDRMALNATMIPTVNLGPSISLQAETQPPVITLHGSFIDPEINVFDHATGKFFLSKASDGTLVQFGDARVDSLRRSITYDLQTPAPGDYTIEVDVTYGNLTGIGQTRLYMLPSYPATPPLVDAGPDVSVTEGTDIHMFGTFSDPSATYLSFLKAMFFVTRSDGSLEQAGKVEVDIQRRTLIYDILQIPQGEYTVRLQLTDRQFTGEDITHLQVWPYYPPPAPKVVAPADGNIVEGSEFGGVYSFSDNGVGPWKIDVTPGNGTPDLVLNDVRQPGGYSLSTVYYLDSASQPGGVYHGSVTVTNLSTGLAGSAPFTVRVHDAVPLVNAGPDVTVIEGSQPNAIHLNGSFSSPAYPDVDDIWSAWFTLRTPSGTFVEDGPVLLDLNSRTLKYDAVNLAPGSYTITLQVTDGDATGTAVMHLTVLPNPVQHAPVVVAPTGGAIKEGGTYAGTYSFTDPDGGPWNVRIDLGNGSKALVLNNVKPGAFNLSAVYLQNSVAQPNGVYRGTVTVTDSTGLSGKASFTVLVRAQAPVVHAPSAVVVSGRPYGWYAPVTVSYSVPAGRLSAFFLVRNQRGQIVEAGNGLINPYSHTVVFFLRGLPPGRYTIAFYLNHDGAIGLAESSLQVLPFGYQRGAYFFFAVYGRSYPTQWL